MNERKQLLRLYTQLNIAFDALKEGLIIANSEDFGCFNDLIRMDLYATNGHLEMYIQAISTLLIHKQPDSFDKVLAPLTEK